ncbi:MAG: hypothetical protein AAFQ81_18625, partial [Pseudomonadota bacterium]
MSEDLKAAAQEIARLRAHIEKMEAERKRLSKRDWNYQVIFDRVTDQLAAERPCLPDRPGRFEGLSFVICYYDIPRQIERTLACCAPAYQGGAEHEIEVVIVDNGSPTPLPDDLQERFPHVRQII